MASYDQYINLMPAMGNEEQQWYKDHMANRQRMIQEGLTQGGFNQAQLDQLIKQGDIDPKQLGNMADYNKSAAERQMADMQMQIQQYELDKKKGFDKDGRPIMKDWESIANEDGTLKDQFKLKDWQNVNPNTGALEKLRTEAMRGPGELSQGSQLQLQKQQMEQAQAMDQASYGGAMQRLAAESQLAQNGGLSGGARERMAKSSFRDSLLQKQQVNRQGALDRMGIMSKDEEQRLGALGQLQGMDNQQADIQFKNQQQAGAIQESNIKNSLNETLQKRAWDANQYNQLMAGWGAEKSAQASANAARGGGGKK